MAKVKITVIKKMTTEGIFGADFPVSLDGNFPHECPRLNMNEEFIVQEDGSCPSGFCGWAFADIQRDITHLRFHGSYPWFKDGKVAISCCTDGLRPVFFKLERLE